MLGRDNSRERLNISENLSQLISTLLQDVAHHSIRSCCFPWVGIPEATPDVMVAQDGGCATGREGLHYLVPVCSVEPAIEKVPLLSQCGRAMCG